jgi:hypothetical protein
MCKYNLEENNNTDLFQTMSLLDHFTVFATTRGSGSILITQYNISVKMALHVTHQYLEERTDIYTIHPCDRMQSMKVLRFSVKLHLSPSILGNSSGQFYGRPQLPKG